MLLQSSRSQPLKSNVPHKEEFKSVMLSVLIEFILKKVFKHNTQCFSGWNLMSQY